ncbi:MAG: DNA adenine methylase [Nitrospirae bacterium]|nr:DNA adenine methylase [Nitrospirota bacterium]
MTNDYTPFVKWAGGKRQLLSTIDKYLPPFGNNYTYYEPFIGGGALLFHLQPKKAVINDSNAEIANCYEVIRDYPDELIADLQEHNRKNNEEYYYEVRDSDRKPEYKTSTKIQRAARILYLNKTCYNGLFRVNSQGQFNVPFGRYKKPAIVNEAVIRAASSYLKQNELTILHGDFKQAVNEAKEGDFVYFDPPYDVLSSTSSFTSYDVNGFDRAEQERLFNVFQQLDKRRCYVMLSNSSTDFIRKLYKNRKYKVLTVSANRAINSVSGGRGKIDEVLVINYEPT